MNKKIPIFLLALGAMMILVGLCFNNDDNFGDGAKVIDGKMIMIEKEKTIVDNDVCKIQILELTDDNVSNVNVSYKFKYRVTNKTTSKIMARISIDYINDIGIGAPFSLVDVEPSQEKENFIYISKEKLRNIEINSINDFDVRVYIFVGTEQLLEDTFNVKADNSGEPQKYFDKNSIVFSDEQIDVRFIEIKKLEIDNNNYWRIKLMIYNKLDREVNLRVKDSKVKIDGKDYGCTFNNSIVGSKKYEVGYIVITNDGTAKKAKKVGLVFNYIDSKTDDVMKTTDYFEFGTSKK